MAKDEHRPITQSSSTPGHRQLPQRGGVDCDDAVTNGLLNDLGVGQRSSDSANPPKNPKKIY